MLYVFMVSFIVPPTILPVIIINISHFVSDPNPHPNPNSNLNPSLFFNWTKFLF